VHSRVEIVAECDAYGRTHLTRLWAEGAIGVRRTGDSYVHLVGTAAGPIGADTIEIDISVSDGACLSVEGVAATIALPGATPGEGQLRQHVRLGERARLHLALPALIVTQDAFVRSQVEVDASKTSQLVLLEQVSLGRFQEAGGAWSGRMLADFGGSPALRQSQNDASILHALGREGESGCGALVSRLELGPARWSPAEVGTHAGAINAVLAQGGRLLTAVGASLARAHRELNELLLLNTVAPAPEAVEHGRQLTQAATQQTRDDLSRLLNSSIRTPKD